MLHMNDDTWMLLMAAAGMKTKLISTASIFNLAIDHTRLAGSSDLAAIETTISL